MTISYTFQRRKERIQWNSYLFPIEPENVEYGFGVDRFDLEGRTLLQIMVILFYSTSTFPNGKMSPERLQYQDGFLRSILRIFDNLKDQGRNIVDMW